MTVFLCSICNVSSGSCNEDCKFCTQSIKQWGRYRAILLQRYIANCKRSKRNRERGATGFCLVTSGQGTYRKKLKFICEATRAVLKQIPDFNIIACNGTATLEQLRALKEAGVTSYNHNLETSEDYYTHICETHTWQERFDTCLAVKEAGLNLVSGGIFGLGETKEQRVSFINALKKLKPKTVPLNFFIQILHFLLKRNL